MLKPDHNYFQLFDLEPAFAVDLNQLADRYRQLQQVCHPDRVAGKSAQDVRVAVQKAALVNQAYDTLKSPVARAQYLLELQGVDVSGDNYVTRDGLFLIHQMEMREALEEIPEQANPFSALEDLAEDAHDFFDDLQRQFDEHYRQQNFVQARESVAKMQFFAKFLREIEEMEARLDDE
jgi:molecular chaperone HscB